MTEATIPLRHVQVIVLELVRRGISYSKACELLSLPEISPNKTFSDIDISASKFAVVCEQVNEMYGDKLFCLRLASKLAFNEFSLLGGLLNHQNTLVEALQEFVSHYHLIGKYCPPKIEGLGNSTGLFCYYDDFTVKHGQSMAELRIAGLARLIRHITSHLYPDVISEIHFQHKAQTVPCLYQDIVGCKVVFESQYSGIVIPNKYLFCELLSADSEIKNSYQKRIERLNKIDNNLFSTRLSAVLESSLPLCINQPDAAKQMAMSVSKLKRMLLDEGSSFSQVQDQVRGEYIRNQLLSSQKSIDEISSSMGFNSSSSLSQLFKRIYGITPGECRKQG